MGENSKIQWTDHTMNFWIGCTKVSAACDNCYAETTTERYGWAEWGPGKPRYRTKDWSKPHAWNRKAANLGIRYRVFSNSLSDFFDAEVPDAWRDDAMKVIEATPNLDWLLLTKRPKVMREYFERRGSVPNVWAGTTVENQEMADLRIPLLLEMPAAKRFLSCEPLLGPVDLTSLCQPDATTNGWSCIWKQNAIGRPWVDWVIVGGESGKDARPMHPDWARSLRDQCQAAGVPFFFKQWGEWTPGENATNRQSRTERTADWNGDGWDFDEQTPWQTENFHHDDEPLLFRLGKKAAGRLLDGREWNEVPSAA